MAQWVNQRESSSVLNFPCEIYPCNAATTHLSPFPLPQRTKMLPRRTGHFKRRRPGHPAMSPSLKPIRAARSRLKILRCGFQLMDLLDVPPQNPFVGEVLVAVTAFEVLHMHVHHSKVELHGRP